MTEIILNIALYVLGLFCMMLGSVLIDAYVPMGELRG